MGINPYERELSQAQACCFLKTVQLNSNVHDFRLDGPGWWWWTLSWRWDVEYIFHLARETVARFDDIFDLCSLVRLRFICQIWHIFTSIWAMYPISLGYKLIFDSPQSDWLPIRWIYSNSPSLHCHRVQYLHNSFINFFHLKLLHHLHKVVIHLSELLSLRSLEPNWVGSRSVSVHSPQYGCTAPACPRRDPITGSPAVATLIPSFEVWTEEWGQGGNSQKLTWAGVSGYLWRAWHSLVCCPGVKLSTLFTIRQPALWTV